MRSRSRIVSRRCAKTLEAAAGLLPVTGNAKITGDAIAAIALAYEQAHAVAITPPDADKKIEWGYSDFGPPGTITKREHIADLDIVLITFENGARLTLKKTNFEAGRINLSARVGNGSMTRASR